MGISTKYSINFGIFLIGAILLFIGFSLRMSEGSASSDAYRLNLYFDDAAGLARGSKVLLGGIRVGQVTSVDFDTKEGRAVVEVLLDSKYQLPKDSVAVVQRSAFIGSSLIAIEYGKDAEMLATGSVLTTRVRPGLDELMESVSATSDDARKFMANLDENQKKAFQQIQEVVEENRENLREASKSFANAGPKLEELAANLQDVSAKMRSGEGTIGKLFADETLYTDLKAFTEEAKKIAADIRDGDGTLSKLIYDDSISREAEASFKKLGDAGDEIKILLTDNKEDITKAIESFQTVGPKLEEAAKRIEEITLKLNSNEGTLGRLINDPSLYDDTKRTVNQVGESFEAGEEQGVIRSFIGILFGALV
jgi:phospholipid/cholesterol/gamma-HCH transport system substrate-binding protein